ncbi:unnamed protein product [Eruca vesicaria subsp. sativa]|uniref:GRF-type domain-containing protein n=1 Tax=Eruca vesicaria subsp. sativa TaxID=29727 RepID=A0ABC8M0V2_ERUVS|nr:unnamed protein product [Eruca vesicaria subsp. sativa]
MSDCGKGACSSKSGSGSWVRRRGRRARGFPKYCQCGEEVVIKTSRTVKNPGRLFHCCPYGSEEDKSHLFSWTDECMVEEIEDLKSTVTDVKAEISEIKSEFLSLEKQLQRPHEMIQSDIDSKCCCLVM